MTARTLLFLLLVLGGLLAGALLSGGLHAQSGDERCFSETDHCISGPIRAYWEQNGGLPVFGLPITAQAEELVEGQPLVVQWFERDRLEIQPDGTVTAGRLGAEVLAARGEPWQEFPKADSRPEQCVFFPQTEHTMCPPFSGYWQDNGGLERFGYPITEAFQEELEGQTFTVQYYERRRIELHPEADPPFQIQLGLLGRELRELQQGTPAPEASGQLAFSSLRDGTFDIFTINLDGSNTVNLTNHPSGHFRPVWSPDGSRIAFGTNRNTERIDVYVMNADGSNVTQLTSSESEDLWPTWSPDGTRIAFHSNRDGDYDIYVMNADGSNPVNLTNNDRTDTMPAWSPDGSRIAFMSHRDGNQELYILDLASGAVTRLTDHPSNDIWPAWSP
jgi:hypothetical protein